MYDLMVDTEAQAELINVGGGHAQIYSPDGKPMCDPLAEDEEGLLLAEIDLGAIAIAKSFGDPVGHYARPDVTRLLFDPRPQNRVEEIAEDTAMEMPADDGGPQRDESYA
jgi:aliphatic nitrilase